MRLEKSPHPDPKSTPEFAGVDLSSTLAKHN
jgi:hypothetical protein